MSTFYRNLNPVPARTAPQWLAGQKALVTGANSGIGRAVAIALGQADADVVVNFVEGDEAAQDVVKDIERSGSKAYAARADVSSESDVALMFARMFKVFGTIDILVNNAGIQRDAPIQHMSLEQWNAVLNVNLTGQFLCSQAAIENSYAEVSCGPSPAQPER